jgi:hypothetical protein
MAADKTRRVVLKKSIPVLFFYVTSFIDQYDNLTFYSDIYGYDTVLENALNKVVDVSDQEIFAQPASLGEATVMPPKEGIKLELGSEGDVAP